MWQKALMKAVFNNGKTALVSSLCMSAPFYHSFLYHNEILLNPIVYQSNHLDRPCALSTNPHLF